MQLRADEVRAGHRIEGQRVVWARPLPDYTQVVIGLDPRGCRVRGAGAYHTLWLAPVATVHIDDEPTAAASDRVA
jgi:hypothetical protein